ncbi:MAG: PilT/PilU family type 4a pilus ATPase [Verrucomicrobiota bacterium]
MKDYSLEKKVYHAQGQIFSILDLLSNFSDSTLEANGMPRVSDLHMKVGEPVRFRFDGQLEQIKGGERLTESIVSDLVFPMLSEKDRLQLVSDPQCDIDAGFRWDEKAVNFRLNVFHDREGLACVMRMLPRTIPEIDELGFMYTSVWEDLVQLKQGLVLVTGITGSGKSTTLASLIDYINKSRKVRIITLEDPIEYTFESEQSLVSQREVGKQIRTFAQGLRSALREDPDVILVGEMRDMETAALALSAAETGHLVLSTLHSRDAKGAFSRIVDMFPKERMAEVSIQVSHSLSYIISQKLLRRAEGKGRVPVFEVLKNTPAMGNLMRSMNMNHMVSQIEISSKDGMNSLEQHLAKLVQVGVITRSEALAHANADNLEEHLS